MYIGGGGGECTGGQTTSCPYFEVPGHHYLVEDSTYNISGSDTNMSVPFDALEIQLPADHASRRRRDNDSPARARRRNGTKAAGT
jgi:hypothetical protein